jgi:hypothetical protein
MCCVDNVKVINHAVCRVDALGEDTNTDLGVEHRLKVSNIMFQSEHAMIQCCGSGFAIRMNLPYF